MYNFLSTLFGSAFIESNSDLFSIAFTVIGTYVACKLISFIFSFISDLLGLFKRSK